MQSSFQLNLLINLSSNKLGPIKKTRSNSEKARTILVLLKIFIPFPNPETADSINKTETI